MADVCSFRKSGCAGGEDEQRWIVDCYIATFTRRQRASIKLLKLLINRQLASAIACAPYLRIARESERAASSFGNNSCSMMM
jgi:hypothetical protein